MTVAAGVLNLVLGSVYLQYGTMTIIEMRRNWNLLGFSSFGAAWIAMAFTCGPHHMAHGIHMLFEGRQAGVLDLVAVAVGAPAGVIWFALRLEAFFGGRGDRHITGNPVWVLALPTLYAVYLTALVAVAVGAPAPRWDRLPELVPNALLVFLYGMVAWYVTRTQIANRQPLGGWSVSGISLAIIFWTCAVMHAVYGLYTLTGVYAADIHGLVVDILAVPAAVVFLVVVRALHHGRSVDWNRATRLLTAERPAPAGAPADVF